MSGHFVKTAILSFCLVGAVSSTHAKFDFNKIKRIVGPGSITSSDEQDIANGNMEVFEYYFSAGANIKDISRKDKRTMLNGAIENGQFEMVKLLTDKGVFTYNQLGIAYKMKQPRIAEYIIKNHPNKLTEIDVTRAVLYGDPEVILSVINEVPNTILKDELVSMALISIFDRVEVSSAFKILEQLPEERLSENVIESIAKKLINKKNENQLLEYLSTTSDSKTFDWLMLQAIKNRLTSVTSLLLERKIGVNYQDKMEYLL